MPMGIPSVMAVQPPSGNQSIRSEHSIHPQLPERPLEQLQEDLPPMENMGYDQVSVLFLLNFFLP